MGERIDGSFKVEITPDRYIAMDFGFIALDFTPEQARRLGQRLLRLAADAVFEQQHDEKQAAYGDR